MIASIILILAAITIAVIMITTVVVAVIRTMTTAAAAATTTTTTRCNRTLGPHCRFGCRRCPPGATVDWVPIPACLARRLQFLIGICHSRQAGCVCSKAFACMCTHRPPCSCARAPPTHLLPSKLLKQQNNEGGLRAKQPRPASEAWTAAPAAAPGWGTRRMAVTFSWREMEALWPVLGFGASGGL